MTESLHSSQHCRKVLGVPALTQLIRADVESHCLHIGVHHETLHKCAERERSYKQTQKKQRILAHVHSAYVTTSLDSLHSERLMLSMEIAELQNCCRPAATLAPWCVPFLEETVQRSKEDPSPPSPHFHTSRHTHFDFPAFCERLSSRRCCWHPRMITGTTWEHNADFLILPHRHTYLGIHYTICFSVNDRLTNSKLSPHLERLSRAMVWGS